MRGALGILLVGGGVFLLVALFNGTLHFPFGQFGQTQAQAVPPSQFTPQTPNIPGTSARVCNNNGRGFNPQTGVCNP